MVCRNLGPEYNYAKVGGQNVISKTCMQSLSQLCYSFFYNFARFVQVQGRNPSLSEASDSNTQNLSTHIHR